MDSSARWHKSDCSEPTVIADDGVPRCLNCDASSATLVARLVAQNYGITGDIHLPAAAPLGESNFWWPPCVPYKGTQIDVRRGSWVSDNGVGSVSLFGTGSGSSSVSIIYPSSLDADHFRLIYLESDDSYSPIHISLEEHSFDDCPEYETVSYLWGGEGGDSTLCKPVYVGIFWDVILATKNCWALLHYLRPRKGCRSIWMDAICINQADNIEKPAQISRMCEIYTNCERVVAYFGEDLVSLDPTRTFRRRVDFQRSAFLSGANSGDVELSADFLMTCAKTAGLLPDQLYQRRYLTRIWIVQELLLSKRVVLPLGDSDVLCHGRETIQLLLRTDRERMRVSGVDGKSLSRLLKATAHCQATDPRDKIFGLLGLFEPRDTSRELVPDYSLSWRDCWVGTAAYMILVEGNLVLLAHAVGNNPSNLPTWVPDIQEIESWFYHSTSSVKEHVQSRRKVSKSRPSSIRFSPINSDASGATMKGASITDASFSGYMSSLKSFVSTTAFVNATSFVRWATEFVMYSIDDEELRVTSRPVRQRVNRTSHRLVHPEAPCTLSIHSASINSSDGGLQIQALRVFNRPVELAVEAESHGLTSVWIHDPSAAAAAACFRVTGLKKSYSMDHSENYNLFIISCQDLEPSLEFNEHCSRASNPFLLALTTRHLGSDDRLVKFHDRCIIYDVHFYSMDHVERISGLEYITNRLHSPYWILHTLHEVVMSSYDMKSDHDWVLPCIFPSLEAKTGALIPLMLSLNGKGTRGGSDAQARLLGAAAREICPDFGPRVDGDHLYLTIQDEEMLCTIFSMWDSRRSHVPRQPPRDLYTSRGTSIPGWTKHEDLVVDFNIPPPFWMVENDDEGQQSRLWGYRKWVTLCFSEHHDEWEQFLNTSIEQLPVTIRFPTELLLMSMKKTTPYSAICYAAEYCTRRGENLEDFLYRPSRPDDHYVFAEHWGRRLVEELGVAWELETITVV